MNTLLRILTLIRKELQVTLGDPQGRKLVILPVLLQSLLFPLAVTLEVKNNTLAILDEDNGRASHEIVQRLSRASAFTDIITLRSEESVTATIDSQGALAVVRFPADFSRCVARGETAPVQILLDGRRSNSSQIAASYIQTVVQDWFTERAVAAGSPPASEIVVRNRYNPNLDYPWFVLPSLVAVLLTISALILTALSVAREREQGTFDQLLVSPLTPWMIMLGKALAALVIGLGQISLLMIVAVFVFHVPFTGSLALLYVSAVLYFASLAGVGLLISAMCSTQQQAFLGAFAFMMPAVLLSGFASPVENMPGWLQTLTYANPIRHFIVISKSIFLKAAPADYVLLQAVPLAIIAMVTVSIALLRYRRRFG